MLLSNQGNLRTVQAVAAVEQQRLFLPSARQPVGVTGRTGAEWQQDPPGWAAGAAGGLRPAPHRPRPAPHRHRPLPPGGRVQPEHPRLPHHSHCLHAKELPNYSRDPDPQYWRPPHQRQARHTAAAWLGPAPRPQAEQPRPPVRRQRPGGGAGPTGAGRSCGRFPGRSARPDPTRGPHHAREHDR